MSVLILDVETTGLNEMQEKIIAIGVKFYDPITNTSEETKIFYNEDEKQLLQEFWDYLKRYRAGVLVGFNLDFDWQFLKLRSLKHRIRIIHYKKYTERYDLRLILNPNRYQKGTKLSDYLTFFDIPNGDDTNGSDVPKLWQEGKIEEILSHLRKDVNSTFEIYKICKECGLI